MWEQTEGGSWLFKRDGKYVTGWLEDDGFWYFLDERGVMKTGWIQDDGHWYYLHEDSNGKAAVPYYLGTMAVGWLKYNAKWYYLMPESHPELGLYKGMMLEDCTKIIGGVSYSFNSHGEWIEYENKCRYTSNKCLEFIKGWEAFFDHAYYDGTGYTDRQLTIGYGTTKAVKPEAFPNGINSTCTEEQATSWLSEEVCKYENALMADLNKRGITLKQNEFDALLSFSYNCGIQALLGSTLYRNICNGIRDNDTIYANFIVWCHGDGGKVYEGLKRRRISEFNMFMYSDYTGNKK